MHRDSEVAALIKRIKKAGGTVKVTRQGHLRVTGPAGVAFVGSSITPGRGLKNTVATLRRCAGLDL